MGLLGSVFNFIDPILDKVDPAHNYVQEWTTGSKTTEGQSPYFETIFPMVVDGFFPGVGSAIGAADKASTGNYAGAGISALGAMYGLGSLGSTGSSAAGGAEAATAASSADDVATAGSTASNASGYTSGYDSFASSPSASNTTLDVLDSGSLSTSPQMTADVLDEGSTGYVVNYDRGVDSHGYGNFNSVKNEAASGQPGYGWQYKDNGYAVSPDGKIYSMGEQVTGAGGQPMGLLDHAGVYADKAGRFINGKDAQQAMKIGAAGMATDQKLRAQQALKQQQMMPRPVEAPEFGANSGRQVRSFQELSPYQNFNGGFNPRRMSRSGLLG